MIKSNSTKSGVNYETYKPGVDTVRHIEKLSGTIFPQFEVQVKSNLSGILDVYFVENGQQVNTGDSIARVKIIPDPRTMEQTRQQFETARIQWKQYEKVYLREKQLFEKGVVSKSDFDQIESEYLISQQDYEAASKIYDIALNGYASGNTSVSNVIRATAKGTLIDLPLAPGASITERNNFNEGTSLAVIADLENYVFKSRVNEMVVPKLIPGKEIVITVNSLPNAAFTAVLSKLNPKGEKRDGVVSFAIEAILQKSPDLYLLKPGFTAVANLEIEVDSTSLVVFEQDILFKNDSTFVEVLNKEQKKEKIAIVTGTSDGIKTAVIHGIDTSTLVVKQ
jgi:HlyD family secretion protein